MAELTHSTSRGVPIGGNCSKCGNGRRLGHCILCGKCRNGDPLGFCWPCFQALQPERAFNALAYHIERYFPAEERQRTAKRPLSGEVRAAYAALTAPMSHAAD